MRGRPSLVLCACACFGIGALGSGCLDADGDERPGYSPHLRAADGEIPPLEADERLRKRVDARDNVENMLLPLRTGFAAGEQVQYFDFGTLDAMAAGKPQWRFRRAVKDGEPEDFGHLDLVDSAPGDTGYSPLRALYLVLVTPAYRGERITSLEALEDALEIGLVEEPVALGSYSACPIVLADTELEAGEGTPPPLDARKVYYRGHVASCFGVRGEAGDDALAYDMRGMIPAGSAYGLRRQNETRVLDEALWQADLNDDGDMRDSNLVFTATAPAVSAFRMYDVTVPPAYEFGASRAEGDLFERQMMALSALDGVITYADSGTQRLLIAWSDAP